MDSSDPKPLRSVPPGFSGIWGDALAVAGFPGGEIELLVVDDDPKARLPQWGLHLGPYDSARDVEQCLTEAQCGEVRTLCFDRHRIILWAGAPRLPREIIRALVRHELRHAEQFARDKVVYRLGIMIAASLGRVYTGNGASSILRLLPHEEDANAAASRFVAPIGETAAARDATFGALMTETTRLRPLDSLGRRTLAFAALHPGAFVDEARARNLDWRFLLGKLDRAGTTLFRALVEHDELRALLDEVAAAIPTDDMIAAEREPAKAWEPLRERLAEAQELAEHLVEARPKLEMSA